MNKHLTKLPERDKKNQRLGENLAAPSVTVTGRCTGLGTAETTKTVADPYFFIHATALLYAFALILAKRLSEIFRLP
jgi:hypothetical protein